LNIKNAKKKEIIFKTKNGGKSYFTLHANVGFSPWQLEKKLKRANPYFLVSKQYLVLNI
jgi:hypothetical protein